MASERPVLLDAEVDAYVNALGCSVDRPTRALLGECLATEVQAAREAWGFSIDVLAFCQHLARNTPTAVPIEQALKALHISDMYLAFGCLSHHEAALDAFRQICLPDIRAIIAQSSRGRLSLDELEQAINEKLFVGDSPKIADYRGQGALRAWVRVVASRTLLDLVRSFGPTPLPLEEEGPLGVPTPEDDPELAYLKARYRTEIKLAFEEAVQELSPEQRNLLREYYVFRLTVDQIGKLRGYHRATAARKVAAVREAVLRRTRLLLMERIGVGRDELESLVRLVESQMHVTVERLFGGA